MDFYIFGQQIVNGLTLGSIYGLIAVGYTMVYGIIGMINFAHGDIYMVSAYISAITLAIATFFGIQSVPFALLTTLIVTMVITGLYGWTIERAVYRPLTGTTRLAPLITAIGVSLVLQNYVQLAQGPNVQGVPTLIASSIRLGDENHFIQIRVMNLIIMGFSIAAMAGLTWLIHGTSLGRQCRAVQQDRKMATILGVNTARIVSMVFVMGSVLAAIAGVLVTMNYGSFDFYVGFIIGIKAFSAAVLGGIGSLPGAMLGGLLLGVLESLFAGFISSDYKDVFAFGVLVAVLIFKPSGLLGRPAVEKV
ncbi:branched-chain amino acid ABC transporter permease LivH [Paenalcaligenes niemegkensis]|uniref:branched-chain amino acid ABC transporter permease n=1 Tax=Paenalcaligenes niemegkensis TaxID=2895469 RepID=UPI001EE7EC60|nr:branched-chain amino acid ABC transporter permease LivH [Paenalcaligenes niemegkensis]MCQ9615353.1 branched-chain amino acid ABC transporter permease LivH [Paenalcaligenes niemegkensis]